MRPLLPLLALCAPGLSAPAASANDSVGCRDLWFTRNLVMDRAGYCFGSALGQAVFDNDGCTGKNVRVDPAHAGLVAQIQALEAEHGCKVDTRGTTLDLDDIAIRRSLDDLPLFDEFPGGCLGWTAAETPLRAGHDPSSRVIGAIAPGDYVYLTHVPVDGWAYVTVHEPGWGPLKGGGWLRGEMQCRDHAG